MDPEMLPLKFKNFSELENRAEINKSFPQSSKLPVFLEKMKKLNEEAKKASLRNDQEQEYIFLFRYLTVMNLATKCDEFKKENYKEVFRIAVSNMSKCEELKEKLKSRYLEKENNVQNSKLSAKLTSPIGEKSLKDLTNNKTAGKIVKNSIDSKELYSLYSINKHVKDFLIIDARSSVDFKESHLNFPNVINIPDEVITAGVTAATLSKSLPEEAKELWEKRGSFTSLIIFDWNTSEKTMKQGTKLHFLKEAMTKWDYRTQYKSQPILLEGGYEELLDTYPHCTTNPKVKPPLQDRDSIPSLDSFDYPMQVLEPEVMKKPPTTVFSVTKFEPSVLAVDRSTKPKLPGDVVKNKTSEVVSTEKPNKLEEITDFEYDKPSEELKSTPEDFSFNEKETSSSTEIEEDSSSPEISPDPKQFLDELRKVKPDIPINTKKDSSQSGDSSVYKKMTSEEIVSETKSSEKRPAEGITRIPLKKEDGPSSGGILKRSSSSPNIAQMDDDVSLRIPSFTRSNKPVVYAERTDSTYGTTAAGLTGLKNFANNCYMNSILQCLSNTKPLVTELIPINKQLNKQLPINCQSKTRGKIAQEVISAFRNMWSGDVRVYSIKDLKNLLGGLKDIFKGTGHQDSNEFLIILLEYLHDDLNIPPVIESRLDGAREETGEKAWGEFRRKNCSIIQRLFYGQHRSTVSCSTCGHSSVTFEQFFNLFVPIPSKETVTLNDCIQLYMSGEKISGWKCPKCKCERNATKKFDISRLPPILVIALKRFTNEEDSWLQKKENLVTYPIDGLDMERFTVKGSEQRNKRYNLYAMSTHTGTLRAGHYKAICKNHISDKWYMFDDQSVDPLPVHSVRNIPEVYILFYSAELTSC